MSEHPGFAADNPALPLRQMRGMRNRMAHGYFDINLEIVWDTVQMPLAELARQLEKLDADEPR